MGRPEGVCIVRANGEVIPCELAPLGLDEDGRDTWAVATALQVGDRLTVDRLPPHTGIIGPISNEAAAALADSDEPPVLIGAPPSRIERLLLGRRFNRFMTVVCAVILMTDVFNVGYHFGLLDDDWHPALAVWNLLGVACMVAVLPGFWRRGWRRAR